MSTANAIKEQDGLKVPPGNVKNVPLDKPGDKPVARGDRKYRGFLGAAQSVEQSCGQYFIEANDGDTVADITNSSYWANVSDSMRPNDFIYVRMNGEDNRLLHLLVVDAGHLWAAVLILNSHDLTDEAQQALGLHMAEATNDFEVIHKGGTQKWVVQRKSDKQTLQKGLPDRGAANMWITEYQKTLNR